LFTFTIFTIFIIFTIVIVVICKAIVRIVVETRQEKLFGDLVKEETGEAGEECCLEDHGCW